MTFPDTPLPIVVELEIDGVWTDITSDVQQRDDITIVRGKQNEGSTTQAMSCSLTLNNRNGTYSPRNPLGTYFGKIGRNTPIRVKVGVASGNLRFTGEVSSWPAKWDVSGNDAWVEIEAAGVLRRANQGAAPSIKALEEKIRSLGPHKYWPLDNPVGYTWTKVTGGQEFGAPNTYAFGKGDLGPYLPQALSVIEVDTPMVAYTSSSSVQASVAMDFVFAQNAGAAKQLEVWYEDIVDGISDNFWKVQVRYDGTNNDIRLRLVEPSGTTDLGDTSVLTEIEDGLPHHVRLLLADNGANTDWSIWLDGVSVLSGTKATTQIQNVNSVIQVAQTTSGTSVNFGHLALWTTDTGIPSITGNDIDTIIQGYAGETAGDRADRLITDAGYNFTSIGTMADTVPMGPQYGDAFLSQLAEIEATDLGIIYETLSGGIGYRGRQSLYNQTAALTIDYSANELAPPFEPIEDDQNTRNDIFVQRREGDSYQATLETGPLSVQAPPDGVGRYKDEVQVNTQFDGQLADIAYFLLRLGTVDEARFPTVTVDRANPHVVANSTLDAALLTIEIGDKIVITDAAAANFYDDISLLMIGYTEVINWKTHTFKFNCVPASPYEFAEWESAVGSTTWKYDTDASTLNGAHNSSTTSLSVATAAGNALWTTVAGEFPFDIYVGGERITVSGISGASSPQTFSPVTRSVNGVVKAQAAGTQVRLWKTPRFGF